MVLERIANPSLGESRVLSSSLSRTAKFGVVAQLVSALACHAGGRGFESRLLRQRLQTVVDSY